ncbi:MAG: response regulator transcription factor [Ilumatobacteraceae bacterium]
MIKVLVVDDHELVRHGLVMLLESADDVELVGQASDGAEAVSIVDAQQPDVVLMDLSMPGMDGVEATRRISSQHPEVSVVVLSSFSERRMVLEAIDAGAAGYLLKDGGMDDILRAVRSAAQGEAPLSPRAAQAILSARPARQLPELSVREREVVELVVEGLKNKDIAERMGISEKTVKTHLTHVYQRLGVSTRPEMIAAVRASQS